MPAPVNLPGDSKFSTELIPSSGACPGSLLVLLDVSPLTLSEHGFEDAYGSALRRRICEN